MKRIVIGDIHGNMSYYKHLIELTIPNKYGKDNQTIQVGDFGFKGSHNWFLANVYDHNNPRKHSINFGNHDDYNFLDQPYSLGNWSYDETEDYSLMTIRGAKSIDRGMRKEGKDWFENEEMNYEELDELLEIWEDLRPDVVVSHDIPQFVQQRLYGFYDDSITRNYMQMMFERHQPKLWLFGHYHDGSRIMLEGTQFINVATSDYICVEDELEKLNQTI